MIAAGKTTLGRAIARRLGFHFVSRARLGPSYLQRLFQNPSRWGYEAQTAFLIEKTNSLLKANAQQIPYILDRSIEEDALVFFEYFKSEHQLDLLTTQTYAELYKLSQCIVPPPTASIMCLVSYENAIERIEVRTKTFSDYLAGYIESIFKRYNAYIESQRAAPNAYTCDGNRYDWTDESICDLIMSDVQTVLRSNSSEQVMDMNILQRHE